MSDDLRVTYTVKEMLADMDRRANERHVEAIRLIGEVQSSLQAVSSRVSVLESDRTRRSGALSSQAKTWAAAVTLMGIIVNIPAAVFYLSGGHG